jgi:hypothetical protein
MINFDQQTEEVKQDIANIFEGLAKPYFIDYRGNVPKEDLKQNAFYMAAMAWLAANCD